MTKNKELDVQVPATEEVKPTPEAVEKVTKATAKGKKAPKAGKTAPKDEPIEYPEVGAFKEKKDLQKFYKKLTDEQLAEWIELEGLEYTPNDSQPINRMRMAMAILYSHFPKQSAPKKKSKYADFSLEDLLNLALDKEVVFETTDDERILRMRAIMALRAAGHIQ